MAFIDSLASFGVWCAFASVIISFIGLVYNVWSGIRGNRQRRKEAKYAATQRDGIMALHRQLLEAMKSRDERQDRREQRLEERDQLQHAELIEAVQQGLDKTVVLRMAEHQRLNGNNHLRYGMVI